MPSAYLGSSARGRRRRTRVPHPVERTAPLWRRAPSPRLGPTGSRCACRGGFAPPAGDVAPLRTVGDVTPDARSRTRFGPNNGHSGNPEAGSGDDKRRRAGSQTGSCAPDVRRTALLRLPKVALVAYCRFARPGLFLGGQSPPLVRNASAKIRRLGDVPRVACVLSCPVSETQAAPSLTPCPLQKGERTNR